MLRSAIARVVAFCTRRPFVVIAAALALATASTVYTARHFAIKTDVTDLFSPNLPWAQRGFAYLKAFPQQDIVVVVNAPTPELAEAATNTLAHALASKKKVARAVRPLDSGNFFERSALLFLPTHEVAAFTTSLARAKPVLETVSADPSLRGSLSALSGALMAVREGYVKLDALTRPMTMAADTARDLLDGRPATFSWRALAQGAKPAQNELRHFIEVDPVLDYHALEPGRKATNAIAATARELDLGGRYQARVRQTGLVPIDDAQFATIEKHLLLNVSLALAAVFTILWLALRSWRIILPVAVSIAVGLSIAAAWGLILVTALNLISVAFFVLFVGLGIDFGIQFSVRYRAERHDLGDLSAALRSAARKAGAPLALAAAATAVGFSSFLPTSYRGLSELGEIAGSGMIIAFLCSITLLPALLTVFKPPPEERPMGFAFLAPVDRFLERWRIPVVAIAVLLVLAGVPLLRHLRFDFNPLHLRNAKSQSVATFLKLRKDPEIGANAAEIVAPNLAAASRIARRFEKLPEVREASTLESLLPRHQTAKLGLIAVAAKTLGPSLGSRMTAPAPTDRQNREALRSAGNLLAQLAATRKGPGAAAARRLSRLLRQLATASTAKLRAAETAVAMPLKISLADLKKALHPERVTIAAIPPALKRLWLTPKGRARVQVLPKGDPNNTALLRNFARAVLKAAPQATGPAILLYEAANTVVHAFIIAGIFALSAIAVLLWLALRRLGDVAMTLVPLLLAGVVTLELSVLFGLRLNFANIIALPLLLGVGVAFKIYYIMAWRRGKRGLVESTLTRAVIFSAMTTATAFGTLWLSADPGTSSMGQLMALALLCTMLAAVLFQPALMGPPRAGARPPQMPFAEEERPEGIARGGPPTDQPEGEPVDP